MTNRTTAFLAALVAALATAAPAGAQDVWVTMYFASWTHRVDGGSASGWVRTEDIDWDAFTQMNYFSLAAQGDGSLCCTGTYDNMNPARMGAIVPAAHAHGKPILVSVGGWGNYDGFRGAIGAGSRARFVANLVDYMVRWGFDGIDLDMEPINPGDRADYIAFVRDLRTAMDAHTSEILGRPMLTAAVKWEPDMYAGLVDLLDQINIMTYDQSGVWSPQTWHNAALRNGGRTYSTGMALAAADTDAQAWHAAGVDLGHIGIGIDFYTYTWAGGQRADDASQGVTAPLQSWNVRPAITDNVSFRDIAERYGLTGDGSTHAYHRWDDVGAAAYLAVDRPGSADDVFVSYEDARAIREKLAYVRSTGLGGVIIWEYGGGFRDTATGADRNPLTDALRAALEEGAPNPPDAGAPRVDAGAPSDGADAGHVQPRDAGRVVESDAGVETEQDAGTNAPPASGGGGCSAAPGRAPSDAVVLIFVLGLALVVGRRKRN